MEKEIKIYDKCNMNKAEEGKEVWEIVEPSDFIIKDVSKIKILDIGCGAGNAFFHFYVNFGTSDFIGIEMNCLHQIKKIDSAFNYYYNNDLHFDLTNYYSENQNTIDPYFYFKKLAEYDILKLTTEINEEKFKSLFMDKILWGTKIEESKFLTKTNDKFDLIIISKVLHYKDIKNPRCVIKKCKNLLTEDGLIFIKSKKPEKLTEGPIKLEKTKPESKRRKVDEKTFKKWTKNLKELRKITDDSGFLYFLGK